MGHLYIFLPAALLVALLGVLVKYCKCYWLIAGYNTMPQAQKEKVDTAGLGNFLGNWLLILAGMLLAGALLGDLNILLVDLLFWGFFLAALFYILVRAQRFDRNPKTKSNRVVLGLVLGSFILALALVFYGSLPPPVAVKDGCLIIGGMSGFSQPLKDIDKVILKETMPPITGKLNGFDAGPVRKGLFRVEGLGKGRLYIQSRQGPFIYIFSADGYIIINFKDAQQTEELYRALIRALNKT